MKKFSLFFAACFFLAILAFAFKLAWQHSNTPFPLLSDSYIHPRPIAEFERTHGLALSEQMLFRASGIKLIQAVIAAKAQVYLFTSQALRTEVERVFHQQKPFNSVELQAIHRLNLEHESPWLRDYLPIPIIKGFRFLPLIPYFVDFVYRDGHSYDDAAIHQFGLTIDFGIEHLPIVMDGGNFMTNGEICIISEEVANDDEKTTTAQQTSALSEQIPDIFQRFLGCRQTLVVSQIPHPHVDMFLKIINKDSILVNEIDEKALQHLASFDLEDQVKIPKIKAALDQIARQLSRHFKVTRIPMPLPVHDIFFTYSNSMIVNDTVIIPSYKNPDPGRGIYPDLADYASYEEKVREIYASFGFKLAFLPADDLIKDGGAFHCVSFHLPDLEAIVPDSSQLAVRPKL